MSSDSEHHGSEAAPAVAIVREFFDAIVATPEGFWSSFDAYFNDQTVWENVGVARTVGPEEATAFAKSFPVQFHHLRFDDVILSGDGNRVYAERVDQFCKEDGSRILTVRALGVFEIQGGKITHWRDYFDTAGFLSAVAKLAN